MPLFSLRQCATKAPHTTICRPDVKSALIQRQLKRIGTELASGAELAYNLGKSWTTDAPYRETPARRERRWTEGCSVVDMEAAAFFAVAQFRGVQFGQVVYGGDLVVPEGWDERGWTKRRAEREMLFWLAVDGVLGI
jgi:uridine phosphorylase